MALQHAEVRAGEVADRGDAQRCELFGGFGADPVDLAHGQRPDAQRHIAGCQQGEPVGFVELGANLGEELVGGDADGAAQSRGFAHRLLDAGADIGALAWDVAQVDVDLVDAAVFDLARECGDGGLEQAGVVPVRVEIRRQQDGVGGELRGLHHAHGGEYAQRAGFVGGRGDHAAPGIVAQPGKAPAAVGKYLRYRISSTTDHHGHAAQFRVSQ